MRVSFRSDEILVLMMMKEVENARRCYCPDRVTVETNVVCKARVCRLVGRRRVIEYVTVKM